ncbi:Oxidoreductase, zinc-binding dehydrogenase family protein [Rasamsonia emersonii CBS 393.64]|uniref:Oxidoreductase, zinc-binding dehydrogenase family protein n=1 Tax=Rasamsonia emersonii (strain ATCC 16479 / CBS 393.64 / IMI 116815) TaxID=1408163 RepID=A0A0F4YRD5_RASE3|nr:Oxidoreductase, zinc-binding dehydrogenase family protein [Rasamsonia emersonii CBS 393.64]KKA20173.1 Oxidoreductase, zinc-binding dehydrogenase family protein [Rasamsonia emersonii CBS 393.64]
MPTNSAAWLTAEKKTPLEIGPAPYTPPRENEVVIKNGAVAINPVDWKLQYLAIFPQNYPNILGQDVAGEVVEVGSAVTRFSLYTVVPEHVVSPIPSSLSYEAASVLPLGLSTAAVGLFHKDFLNLQRPSIPSHKPTGQTLLVWGGASSVGSNAIQLAVHAGYEVITTASPRNFDYVKKLGASEAFDYNSPTVVDDLVTALKGKKLAGAYDAVGVFHPTLDVLTRLGGEHFIATVLSVPKDLPSGISAKGIYAVVAITDVEFGLSISRDFLPQALAEGKYAAAPEPLVVGKELEHVQEGMDLNKKGVSARKVVVSL